MNIVVAYEIMNPRIITFGIILFMMFFVFAVSIISFVVMPEIMHRRLNIGRKYLGKLLNTADSKFASSMNAMNIMVLRIANFFIVCIGFGCFLNIA